MISKDKLDELVKQLKDLRASSKEEYLRRVDYALNADGQKSTNVPALSATELARALDGITLPRWAQKYPEQTKEIKKTLFDDLSLGKKSRANKYLLQLANSILITVPHNATNSQADYDKLLSFVEYQEPKTIEHTYTQAEIDKLNNSTTKQVKLKPTTKGGKPIEPPKAGDTVRVTLGGSYKASNVRGLIKFMSSLPTVYSYTLTIVIDNGSDTPIGTMEWVHDLIVDLGVETKTGAYVRQYYNKELKRTFSIEVRIAIDFITLAVVKALENRGLPSAISIAHHAPVNIRDPQAHTFAGRPHVGIYTTVYDAWDENRPLRAIFSQWRTQALPTAKARRDAGSFAVALDADQQQLIEQLPPQTEVAQRLEWTKMVVAGFVISNSAMQQYYKDHPEHTTDDWISLKELANYIPRYRKAMANGHYECIDELYHWLDVASHVYVPYIVGTDKKGNKITKHVYVLTRIQGHISNKRGRITKIQMGFDPQYIDVMNNGRNLGVILDHTQELDTYEEITVAMYFQDRGVAQMSRTVRGDPLKITVDNIIRVGGLTDSNRTRLYDKVRKMLNKFEKKHIIDKWENLDGTQTINSRNKNSKTLLIYLPADITKDYITKEQTKLLKATAKHEQIARKRALSKHVKGYTDYSMAASSLGITPLDLTEYLEGHKPIPSDIMDKLDI